MTPFNILESFSTKRLVDPKESYQLLSRRHFQKVSWQPNRILVRNGKSLSLYYVNPLSKYSHNTLSIRNTAEGIIWLSPNRFALLDENYVSVGQLDIDYVQNSNNSFLRRALEKTPYLPHLLAAGSAGLGLLSAYRWYRGHASPRELCLTAGGALAAGLTALKLYKNR